MIKDTRRDLTPKSEVVEKSAPAKKTVRSRDDVVNQAMPVVKPKKPTPVDVVIPKKATPVDVVAPKNAAPVDAVIPENTTPVDVATPTKAPESNAEVKTVKVKTKKRKRKIKSPRIETPTPLVEEIIHSPKDFEQSNVKNLPMNQNIGIKFHIFQNLKFCKIPDSS